MKAKVRPIKKTRPELSNKYFSPSRTYEEGDIVRVNGEPVVMHAVDIKPIPRDFLRLFKKNRRPS